MVARLDVLRGPEARHAGRSMGHDSCMVMRIAGLPVLGPSDLLAGARAVAGWTEEAVDVAGTLPERAARLLDGVEALVGRIGGVADRVDGLLDRVDATLDRVDAAAGQAEVTVATVNRLVETVDAVATRATAAVGRAEHVAEQAAGTLATAAAVAGDAEQVVRAAGGVAADAADIVSSAGAVAGRAGVVVDEAVATSAAARELLDTWAPLSVRMSPLARRFVEQLSEQEVTAAIQLVDHLPQLTEHMETDIMPILATLDRVGPDVHELLDVLKDVRQAIVGVPGFAFFRRRGEDRGEERGGEP